MKKYVKISLGLVVTAMLMGGCFGGEDKDINGTSSKNGVGVDEKSLGLSNEDLMGEGSGGDQAKYNSAAAGTSKKIDRAFQDAPPMIPHDVTGMTEMGKNANMCITCHMPDVAPAMKATPIPQSHFTNFRPKVALNGDTFDKGADNMKNEVSIQKQDKLVQARFNCTQCHAPQSNTANVPKNNFTPEYTSKDGANKSSWSGDKFTDGLKTVEESK